MNDDDNVFGSDVFGSDDGPDDPIAIELQRITRTLDGISLCMPELGSLPSLRDRFAMAALPLCNWANREDKARRIAEEAYAIADLMIAARAADSERCGKCGGRGTLAGHDCPYCVDGRAHDAPHARPRTEDWGSDVPNPERWESILATNG